MVKNILFFFFIIVICANGEMLVIEECPSGSRGQFTPFSQGHLCMNNYIHFRATKKSLCCEEASIHQCTHTGMVSRFVITVYKSGPVYLIYKINDIHRENRFIYSYIYEVRRGNKYFVCAYPIGYLWFNMYLPREGSTPPAEYLPTDHVDITTQLKTCEANKDCGVNEFCGDVINRSYDLRISGKCRISNELCTIGYQCSKKNNDDDCVIPIDKIPYAELKQHFCYKRPEITGNNADKSQFAMQSSKRNFVFCQNDNDCTVGDDKSGFCHLSLAPNNYKWSEHVPNSNLDLMGERKEYAGICVQAKPFSYTFSNVFEKLTATEQRSPIGEKYLPVDFKVGKYRDELKKCMKNADCLDKQFCGNIYSLKDSANFDSFNKFCFAVPEIVAPHNSNTKYTVLPESQNLVPCDKNEDCKTGGTDGNSFCHIVIGNQYAGKDGSQKKLYKGLCAEATVCDTSAAFHHFWHLGGVPVSNTCDKIEDCDGGGNTKIGIYEQDSYENTCVKGKTIPDVNLCCYRKTRRCKHGKVVNGEIRCGRNMVDKLARDGPFAECYGGLAKVLEQNSKLDRWCDWTIEQCCQDPVVGFCPDGRTPLFNEPPCTGYNESEPRSGVCPALGAMCHLGHCCPKSEIDGTGKLGKPEYSYLTNQACKPGIRPQQFPTGYCEPESGNVVILGNLSTDGKPMILSPANTPKLCQNDSECSTNYTKLCIYEESTANSIAYCYHNPKIYQVQEEADIFIIVIIVAAITVIVLAALIGGFVFYKLKLNHKKNGINKKDTEKGKGKNKKKSNGKQTSETPTTPTTPKSASNNEKTGTGMSTLESPSTF